MALQIETPGLGTTVQDRGRYGYYHVGLPHSGALDQYSALAANLMLGNPADAAVLEVAFLGPTFTTDEDIAMAVAGADMVPRVDGEEMPTWESFPVAAGSRVSFDYLKAGARVYIAVAGGIDVPEVLNSRSTYALGALGGYEGRPLAEGDVVSVGNTTAPTPGVGVPAELRPSFAMNEEIRVVMGLYDYRLTDAGRRTFLDTEWNLTPVADRIGFRYRGAELEFKDREPPFGAGSDPSNIVDAPYPIGSIQVPGGVEPIVLHRDAVSGGGYMMVGTVISADMDRVAQSQPGTKTKFVEVTLEEALDARRDYKKREAKLIETLEGGNQ